MFSTGAETGDLKWKDRVTISKGPSLVSQMCGKMWSSHL